MNITCIYFSGTYNTKWVAEKFVHKLSENGHSVKVISCEDEFDIADEVNACDMLGIAFPVYASFAPLPMQNLIELLPETEYKPLFGLTTAGYAAGDVLWYSLKDLEGRGYDIRLLGNIISGNNLCVPSIPFVKVSSSDKLRKILTKAESKIDSLIDMLINGIKHIEGNGFFGRLIGILQRPTASIMHEKGIAKFFADEKCTECGWCVRNCPEDNIELTDKGIVFHDRCIHCMRCYNFCPTNAIQMSEKTKNVDKYPRYQGIKGL